MDYSRVKTNLTEAYKGLSSLKKRLSVHEYLKDKYLVKQVCITSVALSCLEEGVSEYLAFRCSLDEEDRLLLLDLTGER